MSDENVSGDASNLVGEPVPMYAAAMVFIGAWGLLLSILNMFSMAHPTYHVSWGGLLTFETTNAAFGSGKDGFHFEPRDTVFSLLCGHGCLRFQSDRRANGAC